MLQVLPGVGPALAAELSRVGALRPVASPVVGLDRADELRVDVDPTPAALSEVARLRTAVAASVVVPSPARRPTGLLASEVVVGVRAAHELARRQRPRVAFTGLRLAAAGAGTPVMRAVAAGLADAVALPVDPVDGDLLVRARRRGPGWELLVRTTPRPLSVRGWRTERYPGALNATIAAAVVEATDPGPGDRFADLMCGSGTLLIERLARGRPERLLGCDVAPEAVAATLAHYRAARLRGPVDVRRCDLRDLRLPAGDPGFTTLVANPPWGELLGDHADNERLYAVLLDAAHRLAGEGALLAVLTHDLRRFGRVLAAQHRWVPVDEHRFFAKGHHPRLFRLRRAG